MFDETQALSVCFEIASSRCAFNPIHLNWDWTRVPHITKLLLYQWATKHLTTLITWLIPCGFKPLHITIVLNYMPFRNLNIQRAAGGPDSRLHERVYVVPSPTLDSVFKVMCVQTPHTCHRDWTRAPQITKLLLYQWATKQLPTLSLHNQVILGSNLYISQLYSTICLFEIRTHNAQLAGQNRGCMIERT